MTQPISVYARRDAEADYQEHKQKNCIPRGIKAFRQHVEQRVARFLQEGHVFYRTYDPPVRLTREQVADSYDHMYVATYNELRRQDMPLTPRMRATLALWQRKAGTGYKFLKEVIQDEDEPERRKHRNATLKLIQAGLLEVEAAGKGCVLDEGRWKYRVRSEK